MAVASTGGGARPGDTSATTVTVTGNHSGTGTITLTRATVWDFDPKVPTMRGSYAVVLVRKAGQARVLEAAVRARVLDFDGFPAPFAPVFTHRLPAGKYTFTLLTDGPARVVLRARGLDEALTVHPHSPAHGRVLARSSAVTPILPLGYGSAAQQVTPRTFSAVIAYQSLDASEAHLEAACMSSTGLSCPPTDWWVLPTPSTCNIDCGTGFGIAVTYQPGELPSGRYNAIAEAAGAGVATQEAMVSVVSQ